jgi:hypothetical protein
MEDETDVTYSTLGKMTNAYNTVVGKPDRSRSRERSKHTCEANTKMNVDETEYVGVSWM